MHTLKILTDTSDIDIDKLLFVRPVTNIFLNYPILGHSKALTSCR